VTGQPHPAHLVALFQPDPDEAHGLLNLRQTLLRLRQALGPDAETHLHAASDLVRLDLGDALLASLASGRSRVYHTMSRASKRAVLLGGS
jgi:DNA-binding SARP family transcriptional activator